ncbi:MAG TPA: NAD-dependent epimerase/dehydratase family protein [Dehalococcoidia bacterium]|jgi:threonine 3-dehydrogenase|nr:NAD-dependent epimerase/dehydratase family protein [Dehalococcoidia bacterium]
MSILITGGTGFIGVGLARQLVERGKEVVLFDIAPQTERLADLKDKVKVVRGDLKVWPEVLNAVRENGVEDIFHLGAMLSVPSEQNPWGSFQTNIAGTTYVLEAARLFGVKRVIFPSSIASYGLDTDEVITDVTLQRPITMYGIGKVYGELVGRFYRRKFGLDFRCLRYCGVIGPGVKTPGIAQYNAWMIESAVLGRPFECFVTEDTAVPVTYFKDAIHATLMLYDAPKEQIKTVCYNISEVSPAPTAKELELAIKKFIPEAKVTYKPDPLVMEFYRNQSMKAIDDTKARQEWGWQPLYKSLEDIVADFIQEVRTRPQFYGLA